MKSTCRHRWCRFIWLKTTLSPTNIYFTQEKSYIYYQVNILTASSNAVWQKQFSMAPGRLYFCSGLKVHLPFHGVDWNPEHFHIWKTEGIQRDKCSASYLLILTVMYGYRSCVGLPFCTFCLHDYSADGTDSAPAKSYHLMRAHSLTCSLRPRPASTSLWRSYFFQEYLWMSDRFARIRPSLLP